MPATASVRRCQEFFHLFLLRLQDMVPGRVFQFGLNLEKKKTIDRYIRGTRSTGSIKGQSWHTFKIWRGRREIGLEEEAPPPEVFDAEWAGEGGLIVILAEAVEADGFASVSVTVMLGWLLCPWDCCSACPRLSSSPPPPLSRSRGGRLCRATEAAVEVAKNFWSRCKHCSRIKSCLTFVRQVGVTSLKLGGGLERDQAQA